MEIQFNCAQPGKKYETVQPTQKRVTLRKYCHDLKCFVYFSQTTLVSATKIK